MKLAGTHLTISLLSKPIGVLLISLVITLLFICISNPNPNPSPNPSPDKMAAGRNRSFILWLHGLGDSGPANEPLKTFFTSPEFNTSKWSFPSAPSNPVTCNYGAVMPSWFDMPEIPVTAHSPNDEASVLKAVKQVHMMIDKEIDAGIRPDNIFVCGFSQGGALTLASVLLYPKTLGGGAIFSGWVPFNHSIIEQFPADAKKRLEKQREDVYERDIQQEEEGKGLNRRTPEHLAIPDVSISMTPILWSHGISDPTVLFEAGQAGPPFLEKAGVTCEFKAYPGLGHSIIPEELKNLESWIKARFKSSS